MQEGLNPYEMSEPAQAAEDIAHAAFFTIRHLELGNLYGYSERDADDAANARTPTHPNQVEDAAATLRRYTGRPSPLEVTLSGDEHDAQIEYDRQAAESGRTAAFQRNVILYGEEDEFRLLPDARQRRAEAVKHSLRTHGRFGLFDPLDGSNQCAGMGNRSGWCSAVLIKYPDLPAAACITLGDWRSFLTDGHDVFYRELTLDSSRSQWRTIDRNWTSRLIFRDRLHYIVPASKRATIEAANGMLLRGRGIQHVSPLAGNPGLMAGMFTAGAVAGLQPPSEAWDQIWAYFAAVQGLTLLHENGGESLDPTDVEHLLLSSMALGVDVPTLTVGKTRAHATLLRDAYLTAVD